MPGPRARAWPEAPLPQPPFSFFARGDAQPCAVSVRAGVRLLGLSLRLCLCLGLGLGFSGGLLVGAAAAKRLLHGDLEVVAVARRVARDLLLDEIGEDELDEVLREALHLVELAVLDRLGDLVRLAVADEI